MKTLLERDDNSQVIQLMEPQTAQTISVSGTTARNTVDFKTKIVRLCSNVSCYIKFGDSNVTATSSDHYLPAGVTYDYGRGRNTRVAALRVVADGTLYISELG